VTGAILWNYTTWWLRLPTSSSHALVGGLVGAGLAKGGLEAIKASSVQKAAVFLVVSPIAGLLLAGLLMALLNLWLRSHRESGNERAFKAGQLVSSAAVSLGHGTNDAQKTMGVIAALLVATGHLQASGDKLPIPLWVVLAATPRSPWERSRVAGGSCRRWASASPSYDRPAGWPPRPARPSPCSADRAGGAGVDHPHRGRGGHRRLGGHQGRTGELDGVRPDGAGLGDHHPGGRAGRATVFAVTQLSSHVLAGVLLALLGAGLAVALSVGLRRTTHGAHLEGEGTAAGEPRPALAG
jgi:PiT family inorganic phosphate transporter